MIKGELPEMPHIFNILSFSRVVQQIKRQANEFLQHVESIGFNAVGYSQIVNKVHSFTNVSFHVCDVTLSVHPHRAS